MKSKLVTLVLGMTVFYGSAAMATAGYIKGDPSLNGVIALGITTLNPNAGAALAVSTVSDAYVTGLSIDKRNALIDQAYQGDGLLLQKVLSDIRKDAQLKSITLDDLILTIKDANERKMFNNLDFSESVKLIQLKLKNDNI